MTRYEEYLRDHRQNVQYAMTWMIKHINLQALSYSPRIDNLDQVLEMLANTHDESKYTALEYPFYENYFYGDNPADPQVVEAFEQAWLRHIHQNPHHWQHWVLIHDEPAEDGAPDITPLEMPFPYVVEMVADWWSFSWRNDNFFEIFDWYEGHRNTMLLHTNTRRLVERLLAAIKNELEDDTSDDE